MSYVYGIKTDENGAMRLNLAEVQYPAAFELTEVPLPDGKVLWGHGVLDAGTEGTWTPTVSMYAPHVPHSITSALEQAFASANMKGSKVITYHLRTG